MFSTIAHEPEMAVIGIDAGTQSLKAVVVDDALTVLGEYSIPYQPSFPRPGWAEQDPSLWLNALSPAISGAMTQARVAASDVACIAVTGQLDGCLAVDPQGSSMGPAIVWMDRRATDEIVRIDPDMIRERTGNILDATHMAAKIAWVQRHTAEPVATWHQPVSFIVAALCGRHIMDHSLASSTMLYDWETRDWADDLLEAFGIDRSLMPDIADASSVAGLLSEAGASLTGLLEGTQVAVGTGDDFTGAIGAGVIDPGLVSCCVGTAEVVGMVSNDFHLDSDGLVETHRFPGDRFFIENPGWLSGGAVTWFVSTFGLDSAAEMSALAATAQPGSGDLLFLPALSGAMAPRWNAGARGACYGLTASHGRAEMARSVLEGCAFAMRDVVDRLVEIGGPVSAIRLSGGGALSEVWAQIRADVSGLPVEILTNPDSAPLGAAQLALQAAGISTSFDANVAIARTIEPVTENRGIYDRAHRRYHDLFEALAPMFEE
jgi:xylulokinase